MVKLVFVMDIDAEALKSRIDNEIEDHGGDYPSSTALIGEWIDENFENVNGMADFFDDHDPIEVKQIVFEDEEETEDLDSWLKEKNEEEDED